MTAIPTTLYVLAPSHFCERARWGLDVARRPYAEKAWAPGPHMPLARRLAPDTTLPILVAGEQVIQGSGAILTWAGLPVTDADIEHRLETRSAPLIRRYLYSGLLHDPRCGTREMVLHGVSAAQTQLGMLLWPVLRRAMVSGLNARPEFLPELERAIDRELDWLDDHLSTRAPSEDEAFGRTQITIASLLSPLARPAQIPLYRSLRMPIEIERALNRWDDRPTLRWVRRLYAEYRTQDAASPPR